MIAFISGGELAVIFLIVLLLFGAKSIPEIAKSLGKGLREVQHYSNDIKSQFSEDTQVLNDLGDTELNPANSGEKRDETAGTD